LAKKDILSDSDPYVVLYLEDDNGTREVGRTQVIANNNNPIWEEAFSLEIKHMKKLWIELWDEDLVTDDPLGYAELNPVKAMGDEETGKERVKVSARPGHDDGEITGSVYLNYSKEVRDKRFKNDWLDSFMTDNTEDVDKLFKGDDSKVSVKKLSKKLDWNVDKPTLSKLHSLMNVAPENQAEPMDENLTKEQTKKIHCFLCKIKPSFDKHKEDEHIKGHDVYKALGKVTGVDLHHQKQAVSKNSQWGLDHYAKAAASISTASSGFAKLLKEKDAQPNLWQMLKGIKWKDIGSLILAKFEPPIKDKDGEYKWVKKKIYCSIPSTR